MIPNPSNNDGQVRPLRSAFNVLLTTMKVNRAMMIRTKVRSLLPNSITPCQPISGTVTKESSVHLGQVGQPSPEPVRRTKPPVTTIRIWLTKDAQAYDFKRLGEKTALISFMGAFKPFVGVRFSNLGKVISKTSFAWFLCGNSSKPRRVVPNIHIYLRGSN